MAASSKLVSLKAFKERAQLSWTPDELHDIARLQSLLMGYNIYGSRYDQKLSDRIEVHFIGRLFLSSREQSFVSVRKIALGLGGVQRLELATIKPSMWNDYTHDIVKLDSLCDAHKKVAHWLDNEGNRFFGAAPVSSSGNKPLPAR